jgi:predicted protein tyrosine phosphatase
LRFWPWLALVLAFATAVWHNIDFPEDVDPEFPAVVRPTFNRRPPPAYRLAEPGDTLDRIAIYTSALALVLSLVGLSVRRGGLWPAAVALSAAAWWHAVTPGPTFDGWHGLGWRAMFDSTSPLGLRLILALAMLALIAIVAGTLWRYRVQREQLCNIAKERRVAGLLIVAVVLVVLRQFDIPGVEPVGYWPRCAFLTGLIAFNIVLIRMLPRRNVGRVWLRRSLYSAAMLGSWLLLVFSGIAVTVTHRPIDRFRAIVPGRIYISAMPTAKGLEIIQNRHHFKTIIDLFPEDTPLRSSRLPMEKRFAREHGINLVINNSDPTQANEFLDKTLELAQDPSAWPILVHCHACMDRTPAWWGIYRFVVKGDRLEDILKDIERHRGLRPKASVTLLYNRVLEPRAPERYRNDPVAAVLKECARGTDDPFYEQLSAAADLSNLADVPRVSRREPKAP